MQVNIKNLIDDVQCYQVVRELRWPDGVECPSCQSTQVIKRGFDDTEPARQRVTAQRGARDCGGCGLVIGSGPIMADRPPAGISEEDWAATRRRSAWW